MNVSRRAFTLALGVVPSVPGDASNAEGHQLHSTGEASQPAINSVPRPKLFDPHELATVAAVAEVIIPATDTPGAREAHVAEYLDLILSDSPESVRTLFCEGLWWTDGYCQRSAGAPFKDLSVADRLRIVSELYDSS